MRDYRGEVRKIEETIRYSCSYCGAKYSREASAKDCCGTSVLVVSVWQCNNCYHWYHIKNKSMAMKCCEGAVR